MIVNEDLDAEQIMRKVYWAFLVLNIDFLWTTVFAFLAQASTNTATARQ